MKDDFSQTLTPLDLSVSSPSLQMIKLLLPMLPPKMQRMMAVYVKFMEFQNTYLSFSGFPSCENPLDEIKKYIPPSALETYDTIRNMMDMMNMFQDMPGFDESTFDFDQMSSMMNMFHQNQKEGENDD